MIKKIGLIELYAHSEVLYHFSQLYLSQNHQINVFTNDFIYQDAYPNLKKSTNIKWFIRTKSQSRSNFIQQNLADINNCDQVVFITLVSDFKFFAQLKLSTFSTLIIHNAISYLQSYKGIKLVLSSEIGMDVLRLVKFFIKREAYWKKQMLKNFNELCFPTLIIQDYIKKQAWTKNYNLGEAMPFVVVNKNVTGFENLSRLNTLTFTIPGTINKDSRNYEMVYRIFRQVLEQHHKMTRLVLLGSPKGRYGQRVIQLFESLARATFQVTSFKESVPQEEFDSWMQQTDVLILPLRKYLKLGIYREQYGYTNVSGGVNDGIKFGKPMLLPAFYPVSNGLKHQIKQYQNETDFLKQLQKLLVQ